MSSYVGDPRRDESSGVSMKSRSDRTDTSIGGVYDDPAQLTIDDALEDARRRRDTGTAAAELNTWTPWRDAAHKFVTSLPAGTELTSDAIVEAVGLPIGSRNATGAFVQGCIRSGLIEWTGRVRQSTRASRNGGWIKVYRRGA